MQWQIQKLWKEKAVWWIWSMSIYLESGGMYSESEKFVEIAVAKLQLKPMTNLCNEVIVTEKFWPSNFQPDDGVHGHRLQLLTKLPLYKCYMTCNMPSCLNQCLIVHCVFKINTYTSWICHQICKSWCFYFFFIKSINSSYLMNLYFFPCDMW